MNKTASTDPASPDQRLRHLRCMLRAACELVDVELEDADGVTADDQRLATEYERTAALYRRRAARRPEEAERFSERAEWFERRAKVKRSGAPMPRELRTPAETLAVVDEFRQALVATLALAHEFDVADLRTFARCLASEARHDAKDVDVQAFVGGATRLVAYLGGLRGPDGAFELDPYRVPLVEDDDVQK